MNIIIEYFKGLSDPAQIIGFVALIMSIILFQQNEPKKMLICQIISTTLFTVHFFMLGAVTGAAINLMSVFRAIVYSQADKKWAQHIVWTFVFTLIPIVICIFTWEGFISILPVLACVCYTISFRLKTAKLVRIVSFPASPLWIIYNLINKSYAGVLTEVYVILSILVGMLRFDIKKNKKEA